MNPPVPDHQRQMRLVDICRIIQDDLGYEVTLKSILLRWV